MPRRNKPRSSLPRRAAAPEFGARHAIAYTPEVDIFFLEMRKALDEVMPETVVPIDDFGNAKYKKQYRIYDDPKRLGVSILERRLPRKYAQRQRVQWTHNDVGRIVGGIQNNLAREVDLSYTDMDASFTGVVRIGDVDEGPNARKLGLILDQESQVSEAMVMEHEIVVDGISGSLKRFRYPYDTFVPHWTVARISRESGTEVLQKAVSAVQSLLPMEVTLEKIQFYSEQGITI